MADSGNSMVRLAIKEKGTRYEVTCSQEVANMVMSPNIDPGVKELITNTLIKASKSTCNVSHKPSTSGVTEEDKSESSTPSVHIWKEREEDILVQLRHEVHDDFIRAKQHTSLWDKIAKELEHIGCHVTGQQVMNKYNALKKRWKEVIDAPSGTEARYFRHRASFDNLYGTKSSTKPAFAIDTQAQDKKPEAEHVPATSKKVPNKRKSEQVLSCLKSQHEEFKNQMANMHAEKMARMDRMLDLYEQEIEAKKGAKPV